jgi:hypothetical protein
VLPSKSTLWKTVRFHEVRVHLKRSLLQDDDEIYDDDEHEVDEDELSEYSADDYSEQDDQPDNNKDDSPDESDEKTVYFQLT